MGTGNDLSRVLGWGGSCDDDANLTHLLEKYEKASTKMLDRWSIMTFERGISIPCTKPLNPTDSMNTAIITEYEDSIISHLSNLIHSNEEDSIISSTE